MTRRIHYFWLSPAFLLLPAETSTSDDDLDAAAHRRICWSENRFPASGAPAGRLKCAFLEPGFAGDVVKVSGRTIDAIVFEPLPPTRVTADLDGDGDADLGDFAIFQALLTGPARQ